MKKGHHILLLILPLLCGKSFGQDVDPTVPAVLPDGQIIERGDFRPVYGRLGPLADTTLVVDSAFDEPDANPGDGVCKVPGFLECTLRAAMEEANATGGPDGVRIAFDIQVGPAGSSDTVDDVFIIRPNIEVDFVRWGPLPAVTRSSISIDGIGSPGPAGLLASCGSLRDGNPHVLTIVLTGDQLPGGQAVGLEFDGAASGGTVSGLIVRDFENTGIVVRASSSNIECNYVGTDPGGVSTSGNGLGILVSGGLNATLQNNLVSGNAGHGIRLEGLGTSCWDNFIGVDWSGAVAVPNGGDGIYATANTVFAGIAGRSDTLRPNLISGNLGSGIATETGSIFNVYGNAIGTDASGLNDVPNGTHGVFVGGRGTIGVTDDGSVGIPNLISGNTQFGIVLASTSDGAEVGGNWIGTDATGIAPIPNGSGGILVEGDNHTIGGTVAYAGNRIAFNASDGIAVAIDGTSNALIGNSIFANGTAAADLGIDLLGSDGVDANDSGDADSGGNNLQNYPTGLSVDVASGSVTLQYQLDSTPDTPFRIEFFESASADVSGFGEGSQFVAARIDTTGPTGMLAVNVTLPSAELPFTPGFVATATATPVLPSGGFGSTSEFSMAVPIGGDQIVLTGRLLLEGPYSGGVMVTSQQFRDALPNAQPYRQAIFDGTLLEYDGPDYLDPIPAPVTDWIVAHLRSGTGAETELSGSRRVGFVLEDGTIAGPDGLPGLAFPAVAEGAYHVVLCHRNHLCAMSMDPISFDGGTGTWDATTSGSAYSTLGVPLKNLEGAEYGLFAGNAIPDGGIQDSDREAYLVQTTTGSIGYVSGDYDMDHYVSGTDYLLYIANAVAGAQAQVP